MTSSLHDLQVFVRIRPEADELRSSRGYSPAVRHSLGSLTASGTGLSPKGNELVRCVALADDKTVRIMPPDSALGSRKAVAAVDDKMFSFDRVFPEDASQEDMYHSVSAHVKATVRGYNTTIFACK